MINSVRLINNAKNIFSVKRYSANVSKPCIGEELSGKLNIENEKQFLPKTENADNIFSGLWKKIKNCIKKYKPEERLPQAYSSERLEESSEATLKKYLECYKPPKYQSSDQFRHAIKGKLNKFYIKEAIKTEEIITKNKQALEELDKNYQSSIDKILQEIKQGNSNLDESLKYFLEEKVKIDKIFCEKLLNIFAKEYNLEEIKPAVECCEKLTGKTIGGWNAILGKISIDSSSILNSADLASVVFHEYTHLRQDIEVFKNFGQKEFIKYLSVKIALSFEKDNPNLAKLSTPLVFKLIATNPMYKNLEKYAKEYPGKAKGIEKNLIRMRIIENITYKNCNQASYEEYANQLGEIHAHHNSKYFKELYKQVFPNYAKIKKQK